MRLISPFIRPLKLATGLALALLVGGCESVLLTAPALFTASVATLIYTKKLPNDHAASYIKEKDCSSLHLEKQEAYCRDADEMINLTESSASPYCYRTIGYITCYDRQLASGRSVR